MKAPANFDGARFAAKYALGKMDFWVDGAGELVSPKTPNLKSDDLLDCVVPDGEQAAKEQAAIEQAEFLRTLTPKTITDLQTKLATAEAELADAKARLAKLETDSKLDRWIALGTKVLATDET